MSEARAPRKEENPWLQFMFETVERSENEALKTLSGLASNFYLYRVIFLKKSGILGKLWELGCARETSAENVLHSIY